MISSYQRSYQCKSTLEKKKIICIINAIMIWKKKLNRLYKSIWNINISYLFSHMFQNSIGIRLATRI